MTKIYEQHRAAFANVSAYIIMRDGERVATVAFKFPRDGAGRLYAYVHWIGVEMVRGWATGYGYDKCSAAAAGAALQITGKRDWDQSLNNGCGGYGKNVAPKSETQTLFCAELAKDDGNNWDRNLRDAGFDVLQAV